MDFTKLFPDLPDTDMPGTTLAVHQSPDKSMYWLAGQEGLLLQVGRYTAFLNKLYIDVHLRMFGCLQITYFFTIKRLNRDWPALSSFKKMLLPATISW